MRKSNKNVSNMYIVAKGFLYGAEEANIYGIDRRVPGVWSGRESGGIFRAFVLFRHRISYQAFFNPKALRRTNATLFKRDHDNYIPPAPSSSWVRPSVKSVDHAFPDDRSYLEDLIGPNKTLHPTTYTRIHDHGRLSTDASGFSRCAEQMSGMNDSKPVRNRLSYTFGDLTRANVHTHSSNRFPGIRHAAFMFATPRLFSCALMLFIALESRWLTGSCGRQSPMTQKENLSAFPNSTHQRKEACMHPVGKRAPLLGSG
jgi:hypothetical protein